MNVCGEMFPVRPIDGFFLSLSERLDNIIEDYKPLSYRPSFSNEYEYVDDMHSFLIKHGKSIFEIYRYTKSLCLYGEHFYFKYELSNLYDFYKSINNDVSTSESYILRQKIYLDKKSLIEEVTNCIKFLYPTFELEITEDNLEDILSINAIDVNEYISSENKIYYSMLSDINSTPIFTVSNIIDSYTFIDKFFEETEVYIKKCLEYNKIFKNKYLQLIPSEMFEF